MAVLSAADIREVRKALVKCDELEAMIRDGEACGVDCKELRQDCKDAREFLSKVNQVHGPQFPMKS